MQLNKESKNEVFENLGLKVSREEVEIGQTYPIFGMITKLLNDTPGEVVAEINYSIIAKMNIADTERLNVLKERAFESGIFISTITAKGPKVEVDCKTVIFGKRQGYNC